MKILEELCAVYTATARCHLEARKALHELPRQLCLCIPRGVCGDYRPQHTADWLCTRAKSELNARINELGGRGYVEREGPCSGRTLPRVACLGQIAFVLPAKSF